jgi:hypothetical protein
MTGAGNRLGQKALSRIISQGNSNYGMPGGGLLVEQFSLPQILTFSSGYFKKRDAIAESPVMF